MRLENLNCGQCGAPLRVPESAQFVTCNHCQSQLVIRRLDSVTLTEKLEQTVDRLDRAEEQLASLVYQNHVAEENRRWERERQEYLVSDKNGNKHLPSAVGGVFAMLVAGVMSFLLFSGGFGLAGLLPIGMAVIALVTAINKSNSYREAERRHRQRLAAIPLPGAEDTPDPTGSYLQELESAPTPEDYLRQLSDAG